MQFKLGKKLNITLDVMWFLLKVSVGLMVLTYIIYRINEFIN
jgi:hypothetical protein